jgi:hypothetical protein
MTAEKDDDSPRGSNSVAFDLLPRLARRNIAPPEVRCDPLRRQFIYDCRDSLFPLIEEDESIHGRAAFG